MTVPNWITAARIAFVPLFLVLAYRDSRLTAVGALVVFLVASLSDLADGYLARRHDAESRTGKFLDPLADKLLVGAALVVLVDVKSFPLWAALVIAGREIAVQILRTSMVRGGRDLPASRTAKLKTVLQITMVSVWLLPAGVSIAHYALMVAALIATLWSGLEYLVGATRPKEAVH